MEKPWKTAEKSHMPTYEYACSACQNQWEEIQKISEPALDTCPKCQQKTAKRQISAGNFILKGGGWYADLYSSSGNKGGSSSSSSSGSSSSSAPAAKSEAPAAKSESSSSTSSTAASTSTSSAPAKS